MHVRPACARGLGGEAQRRQRLEPRHGDAFPHLPRPELTQDRSGAADVIGIAVRQRDVVEPAESGVADDRRDDAIADVEGRGGCEAAGVDEQRRPARKDDEGRVALAHVDERDVQHPVAAPGDECTRINEDPQGSADREERRRTSPKHRRGAPQRPPQRRGAIVDRDRDPGRRRDAVGQARRKADQIGRPHEPGGTQMRRPPRNRREARRHDRRGHDGHAGNLRDAHQRNREKVQPEPRERHARECQRPDGKQHRFSRGRGGEDGGERSADHDDQPRDGRGRGVTRCLCAPVALCVPGRHDRHDRENRKRRAKGEDERRIDD